MRYRPWCSPAIGVMTHLKASVVEAARAPGNSVPEPTPSETVDNATRHTISHCASREEPPQEAGDRSVFMEPEVESWYWLWGLPPVGLGHQFST